VALSVVERPEASSEAELVAACIAGDAAAQRRLCLREYDRINAIIYRIVGSTRDADDLVQETLIAVFRGLPKFRGESKLSTWIDRIAVRVVFAHIRARKATPASLDVIGDVDGGGGTVDGRAHAREGLRRLYAALSELAPEARIAFSLYAIDGRTIPEVAAVIGTSVVTAKLRIWRARRRLLARVAEDPVLGEFVRDAEVSR
jgi:RNA polymerase sigma-70 factor (ECF subfamily)